VQRDRVGTELGSNVGLPPGPANSRASRAGTQEESPSPRRGEGTILQPRWGLSCRGAIVGGGASGVPLGCGGIQLCRDRCGVPTIWGGARLLFGGSGAGRDDETSSGKYEPVRYWMDAHSKPRGCAARVTDDCTGAPSWPPPLGYPNLHQLAAVRASAMLRQDLTYLVRRRHVLSLHGHEHSATLDRRTVELGLLLAVPRSA
jgi:hypothetical protein